MRFSRGRKRVPEGGYLEGVNEDVGHVVTGDVDSTDLVHGLHPSSENHASQNSRWTFAGEKLCPGVCVHMFSVKDVFDDVELSRDSR